MGVSRPSRASSAVWLASPTTLPRWSTLAAGFSTGCRLCSLMMWNTSANGCPTASANGQPVSAFCCRVQEGNRALGVGRDDCVADARQRDSIAAFAGAGRGLIA